MTFAETDALIGSLAGDAALTLVSSSLLHAELHCAAGRRPADVDLDQVGRVLDTLTFFDLTRGDLIAAGTHAPLRANDAMLLAAAIRLGVDEVTTYDRGLIAAASAAGIGVRSPR